VAAARAGARALRFLKPAGIKKQQGRSVPYGNQALKFVAKPANAQSQDREGSLQRIGRSADMVFFIAAQGPFSPDV
jgi:hypothetical protein